MRFKIRSRLQAPVIHANTQTKNAANSQSMLSGIEIQKRTNENSTANGKHGMITGKSNKRHNCTKTLADLSTIIMFVKIVVAFDTHTHSLSLARSVYLPIYSLYVLSAIEHKKL